MSGIIVCLSAAVLGVDYGWQPVAGGGIEYIIQIEPELLDSLKAGHDLFSDLPAAVRNIRSYRITVGTGRLPHHGEPPPANPPAAATGSKKQAHDARADVQHPAEVDLSQLPGPVLGPALVRPTSPNAIDEKEEPSHLVASESKPIGNRVAGYHAKTESPEADEESGNSTEEPARQATEIVAAKFKERTDGTRDAEKSGASHEPTTEEAESPSDRAREQPQAPTGKAMLVQLALYASLCSNAFLLWVATGQRSRYRALVRRMFDSTRGNLAAPTLASNQTTPRWEQLPSPDESNAEVDTNQ